MEHSLPSRPKVKVVSRNQVIKRLPSSTYTHFFTCYTRLISLKLPNKINVPRIES